MELNYLSILLATAVQFFLGFLWYGPLFSKIWGKIHGFDKLPKATQQKMMKSMGPFYALQALVTLITSFVLAMFITYQPTWSAPAMAAFFWMGFVVPTQVSSVIFGGTPGKWVLPKILILAGGSLLCLEAAAVVIRLFI